MADFTAATFKGVGKCNHISDVVPQNRGSLNPHIQEAKLLLTWAPVESLKEELDYISQIGPHFSALNICILMKLEHDPHANHLRATLSNFGLCMYSASECMCDALAIAQGFYVHNWDELTPGTDEPTVITEDRAARLLERDFQEQAMIRANDVTIKAAEAAKIVREKVLPALPQLETDLDNYVVDYVTRAASIDQRRMLWLPSFLQNALWGPVDPTLWKLSEVKELVQHLSTGSDLLRRLPIFLDHLELHFRRLREISSQQVFELGYSTPEDLTRLYQDRLICDRILSQMTSNWLLAGYAFAIGASMEMPK